MSLYDDLGVSPDATRKDIDAAYRRAAKRHHPDAGGDPAQFARINRAALVLRDPDRRARYDRDGSTDDQPDRSRAMAIEILAAAFHESLRGGAELSGIDLMAEVRSAIRERSAGQARQARLTRKALARVDEAVARLSHNGCGENVLASILAAQQREGAAALARIEQQIEACGQAEAMAAEYAWTFDPAAASRARRAAGPEFMTFRDMEEALHRAGRGEAPFRS